jgi:predicted ATPase/DNA-binding CsgD family transcriptional regulator
VTVDKELFADTLPTYLTRFVGRDREIAAVLSMLQPGRLVTVCGVGGAGKTRLAIEAAKRSRAHSGAIADYEVYWVPLGAVGDPTEVPTAVATGIGLTGGLGDQPLAPVVRTLRDRHALLVLDNCEQVAAACGELVASLLAACPTVTVLATSRIPLQVPAEEVFAIPPMGGGKLPSDPYDSDATALFLDRATIVAGPYALTEHNANALGEICDMLHGLPLAIELAASWIPVLSPRDLLDHLRQADTALASDSPLVEERHRSLAVVLDSSWRWLTASERAVLGALAIFVGGFTRQSAEAVAGADLPVLATLTARSLESTTLFQRLDAPLGACHALVDLGLSLRHEGKLPAALNAYGKALRYQREYRFTTETADSLDGLAVVAAALGHLELAAKLSGTASGWRETYQQESWFPMPNDFQKSATSVRRRLGERAWFKAYEAGRKLNSEQARRLAAEAVSALEEELQRRSSGLTAREIDVLHLVADGLTNAEIAERLVVSQRTVHAHQRSIFDKLGVNSRTAAAHAVASLFASQ